MNHATSKSVWTLNPTKFLSATDVAALRKTAISRCEVYLAKGRKQGVRDWLIIDLGLSAGLRVSEIKNLCVGDVYVGYSENYLHVRRGKGGKQRTVVLDKKLVRHLKEFLAWKKTIGEPCEPNSSLLLSERCKFYTTAGLQKRFKAVIRLAGVSEHYSIHCLRHTFCSELFRKTKNLRLVQRQAGHSRSSITEIYTHLTDDELKAGMDGLYEE